ncbi:hypothetical protein FOA52_001797 [Chlamydomonas sp. UWO 241]|nr:hypothetical protein FOA52_001797 [Chlamydomonas sp. UWO 241]
MQSLMASRMTGRVGAFTSRPCMAPRPAAMVSTRNTSSSSVFLGGMLGGSALAAPAPSRGSLLVVAAGGKSMACTKEGTRRARRRTSGYRARTATKNGRRVIKARRDKGRHSLCPASEKSSGGKKP